MRYRLNGTLTLFSSDAASGDLPLVELVTPTEAVPILIEAPGFRILNHSLFPETIQYCKAEALAECTLGTLVVPDKTDPLHSSLKIAYYFQKTRLIFIAGEEQQAKLTSLLFPEDPLDARDLFHFFFSFLESLIQNDMVYLQNFEKRLSVMEDSLMDTLPRELKNTVLTGRRELLVFHSYYQQMMDLCEILSENENGLFPPDFGRHFNRLAGRVSRLYDHTQMLREYALQIREMHQEQLDLRQNETMRILTVVSTIFFPLSLIAGWYGMNFVNMPELAAPYAYFILIGVCVLIVALEIWYFKKKGWF
ncbi:MAG: CorA family divalent cation transporter [Fusicatenibacter sp.]|nr:CorA family divalent cation transporter [Lachnospiraceae bacterium]MDY2939036.1 CorA family divalent cation transporter [Fusicatenibacter sp.]